MGSDSPNRDLVNGENISNVVDRTLGDVTVERRERLTASHVFIEEIRNGNEANDNNQTNVIRMQVQTDNPDPVTTNSQVYPDSQDTGEDNDEELDERRDGTNQRRRVFDWADNETDNQSEIIQEIQQNNATIVVDNCHNEHIQETHVEIEEENAERVARVTIEEGSEYRVNITDRWKPVIPNPSVVIQGTDSDGWCYIDLLGAWDCMLTSFGVMEEVPFQHQEVWVEAWSEILRRWKSSNTDSETTRALKWLCVLPQALLRSAHRGGESGRGLVAQRFNSLVRGDWGSLIEMLLKDKKRISNRQSQVRREETPDQKTQRMRREIVKLISQGQISKAMNRLKSNGVGDMRDPDIAAQMKEKYPARKRNLQDSVLKRQCVDNFNGFRDRLKGLKEGISPGCGGLRPEFLSLLGHKMTRDQMEQVEEFSMAYVNGDLPNWFYGVWSSVRTCPLFKTNNHDSVRPIGNKNPFVKSIHREVMDQNKEELVQYLEPQQLAMSKAGASKLIFSVRSLLESRPDFVCIKLDFKNAFNEMSRAAIVETLEQEPTLQHLAWFAAVTMMPGSGLETGGDKWGESDEGATQGDPVSGPFVSVGIQREVI